ncbi:ankyrin repeat-containing protein NPR4-like isoform X2 [Prosopis cineraria]|uniref:ankyrin repeat-containing protein NPR4-like isoform X2 n=1 Tax=Prosopis cineraria TaxID=364024 RepID=UPI00240FFCAD|nr:ankyrin repeat-containing protein NPR4-like isoform X2 [Prosopis cineraria]
MEYSNGDLINPPQGPYHNTQLLRFDSTVFRRPSPHLLEDTREARAKYLNICVPLYKYAMEGNWEKAKPMLIHDRTLLKAAIAIECPTVLHIAAGAGHLRFVKELLNLMDESDLDLQDSMGNTAFCFAAAGGNMEMVRLMLKINPFLAKIRGGDGFTPVLFAALQGRDDMARFLYPKTTDILEEADWNKLFLTCIDSDIYDLALKMLKDKPQLALAKDEDGTTGLHILAQKMIANLRSHSSERQNHQLISSGMKHGVALQLVHFLWRGVLDQVDSILDMRKIINEPSRLLFDATKIGNFDFLAELMKSYPDIIWELDDKKRSIIHIAVLYRHPAIFNLIHDISGNKDIILSFTDTEDGNNILHLAAKLAPADRLELVSGAAFQMKLELLWFEEVRKIVLPSYAKKKNLKGETPQELFTKEHFTLRKEAESWMKRTSGSGLVVSTLIATGVFSAAFSIPGGTNDDTGVPKCLGKRSFTIFAISDAIALISSSSSILVFLSILISRYAEYDFYKSLPLKLIFGLVTLFISIASMMIAFSSAFFVIYDHGLKWVPCFISLLSFLPIVIFLFLQFELFYDIIYSTYYLRFLFRPSKRLLY